MENFPKNLSDWRGFDYKFPESTYKALKADIIFSRVYANKDSIVWVDIINSRIGESFHKQQICLEGAGWNIDKESIAEFDVAEGNNPFAKLYTNRLDYSKKGQRHVMIYWFMFKKFGAKDAVSMIRISSPVANSEEETFNIIKTFIEKELFKEMYKKGDADIITNAENIQKEYGNGGVVAMIFSILIPLGVTIIGAMKKD